MEWITVATANLDGNPSFFDPSVGNLGFVDCGGKAYCCGQLLGNVFADDSTFTTGSGLIAAWEE